MRQKDASQTRGMPRLVGVGLLLALGAVVSLTLLNYELRREAGVVILWLGWASLLFISGSSLCLFTALVKFVQGRRSRTAELVEPVKTHGEYIAQYSWSDRAVALALVLFFGGLSGFFLIHSAKPLVTVLCLAVFCWAVYYALQTTVTRVRFTQRSLTARLAWFREVSATYANIQRISGKPGTLKICFSDGRSLKLHSGLGDANTVIAFLREHCPETIHLD
jgi:hypothetical protein